MKQALAKAQIRELGTIIADSKQKNGVTRRAQAVLLLGQQMPTDPIRTITRLSRSRLFAVYAAYLKEGTKALEDKRHGKPKELLTKKQRDAIVSTVKTKSPSDVGISAPFWTTGILGKWIEQEYDVQYKSKTSLYLVFRKASFTYHKPERRYHERDEKEITAWRKKARPLVKRHLRVNLPAYSL